MYCAKNRSFNHLAFTGQIKVRVSAPARERWLKLQRYLMPAMRFRWVKNHNQKKDAQLRRHKMEKIERILKEFDITRIEEDYILPISATVSRANSNLVNNNPDNSNDERAITPTNDYTIQNIEQKIASYITTPVNLPSTFNQYDNPGFSQMSNLQIPSSEQANNNEIIEIISPRNPGNTSAFFSQDISRRLFSSESNLNRVDHFGDDNRNSYQSTQTLNA